MTHKISAGGADVSDPEVAADAVSHRLAFVVTEDWWLCLYWAGIVKAARDAGYEVTVVTRVSKYGERIRALGLDIVDIDFGRGRLSPWINLRTLRRLHAVYRRLRPHLVHHGENGLLVPARDARALADAIIALAADPARRTSMGRVGRRRIETEFAAARIHEQTLRVYEQALARR